MLAAPFSRAKEPWVSVVLRCKFGSCWLGRPEWRRSPASVLGLTFLRCAAAPRPLSRRYADGDDREALEKATVKLTEEELALRDKAIAEGKRVVDYLNSR